MTTCGTARVMAWALALGVALGACTSSSRPKSDGDPTALKTAPTAPDAPAPAPASPPPDSKEPPVSPASAQFTFIAQRRERPPMSTLELDVSLRNPGPTPRWFLLSASVAKGQRPMATSSFGASVWELVGTGHVVVARFDGAAPFYAVQLPAGAEVELRRLQVRLAGELPANPLPLEVITADGFTLGGDAPLAWTKTAATSEARADASQVGAKRIGDYSTPGMRAVPVEVQGAERLDTTVTITP